MTDRSLRVLEEEVLQAAIEWQCAFVSPAESEIKKTLRLSRKSSDKKKLEELDHIHTERILEAKERLAYAVINYMEATCDA